MRCDIIECVWSTVQYSTVLYLSQSFSTPIENLIFWKKRKNGKKNSNMEHKIIN